MTTQELSKESLITTVLTGVYIAAEAYSVGLIMYYILGRFWLSDLLLQIFSVTIAYVIVQVVYNHPRLSLRQKKTLSIAILAGTILVAMAMVFLRLYLSKLQLQGA